MNGQAGLRPDGGQALSDRVGSVRRVAGRDPTISACPRALVGPCGSAGPHQPARALPSP